jgi:hypothetical protein
MTPLLNGMPIHIDDLLGVKYERKQVRFPRSKKRRMQKKWSRQSKNFAVIKRQVPECYRFGSMLVMNSSMFAKLKAATQEPKTWQPS